MAFTRKIMVGLSTTITSLKTWATSTFAPKSHTHTASQITGMTVTGVFPTWTAFHQRGFGSWYTESVNGYLLVSMIEGWAVKHVYLDIGGGSGICIYRGVGDNLGCGASLCIPIKAGVKYRMWGQQPTTFVAYFIPAS